LVGAVAAASCSKSNEPGGGSGSGGAASHGGSGGTSASGGSGSGGQAGSGGTVGSGGQAGSGGTVGAGGQAGSGGTVGSGGTTVTGGSLSGGGSAGSGGAAGGSGGGSGGIVNSGGSTASGGKAGTGGAATGGANGTGGAGSGGATGKNDATPGGSGGGGSGGTNAAGAGGNSTGTGGANGNGGATGGGGSSTADGGLSAKSFTCNTVLGIDSTSEWYTSGFEKQVDDTKWQLIYNHPGYVEDWGNATDAVYSKAPTSPCAANSDNPDRVILNVFADPSGSLTTSAAMVTGLSKAVDTLKAKYSRLKRLDLLTMSRGPNNQQCYSSANTVVAAYVDDAIAKVATAYPGLVTASPKFYVTNCSDFDSSNPPHLSTAGKTNLAKVYGDYYSTEP